MSFAHVVGQEDAINILRDELRSKRISHAYLFSGKDGVGKKTLSFQFTRALFCKEVQLDSCDRCRRCRQIDHGNHPDVKLLTVEEGSSSIKIDQIREMEREISYKPYEGEWKVYIIDGADKMTPEAANSLLKTLEEPPGFAVIILLADEISQLLPTIISRCQQIKLNTISREMIIDRLMDKGIGKEDARLLAMFARGSMGLALDYSVREDFLEQRNEILDFISNLAAEDLFNIFEKVKDMEKMVQNSFPLFHLISSWYRDIMIYMSGGKTQIINTDYRNIIEKQAEQYTVNELMAIISLINDFEQYIERNVRFDLALQVLLLKIRSKRV